LIETANPLEVGVTRADEVQAVVGVAREARVFTTEEVAAVDEMARDHVARGEASQYHFLSCRLEGKVAGFACYGPRSLTRGTYDLFWLGTADWAQRRGVGHALIAQVEERVRALGGRLLIVETSNLPEYAPARRFYDAHHYHQEALIRDFYDQGDDLVLYSKKM